MNWGEALKNLAEGAAVQREAGEENYIDARFGSGPYQDEQGTPFHLVKVDENDEEKPYRPSREDKAATDWCLW